MDIFDTMFKDMGSMNSMMKNFNKEFTGFSQMPSFEAAWNEAGRSIAATFENSAMSQHRTQPTRAHRHHQNDAYRP